MLPRGYKHNCFYIFTLRVPYKVALEPHELLGARAGLLKHRFKPKSFV